MSVEDYVRRLGSQLESDADDEKRVEIARLLGATGSPDAQGYLLDAITDEPDGPVREAFRDALRDLESRQAEA